MARISDGTYQLPLGSYPVVAGTPITVDWANSLMLDLSSALTDSLSRSGLGAMTAPLKVPNGSLAAPALSFVSEDNSGFYRAGTSDIRMSVNGVYVAQFTPTQVTFQVALAGPATGLTGTAASLTSGTANALNTANNYTVAGLTSTGPIVLPGTTGTCAIRAGTGDGSSSTVYNVAIQSWWGIGFRDYQNLNTVQAWIDCRTGSFSGNGGFYGPGTGLTGTAVGLTVSYATTLVGDQTNWANYRSTAVANFLGWKNYGNGHVIFDASQGTSPTGSVVNNASATTVWAPTFPTLMGWNGSSTYGVRVDTARVSESCSGNAATATTANALNTANAYTGTTITASTQFSGPGTGLTGTSNSLNAGLGVNQTWRATAKVLATSYTNSTGKPIAVSMSVICSAGSATLTATVGGVALIGPQVTNLAGQRAYMGFIVPPGIVYSVAISLGTGSSIQWAEMSV